MKQVMDIREVPEGIELNIPEGLYYFDEMGGMHVPLQNGVGTWLAGEILKHQFVHGHPVGLPA